MTPTMIIASIMQALALAESLKEMLDNMKDISPEDTAMIVENFKKSKIKHGSMWEKGDHIRGDT